MDAPADCGRVLHSADDKAGACPAYFRWRCRDVPARLTDGNPVGLRAMPGMEVQRDIAGSTVGAWRLPAHRQLEGAKSPWIPAVAGMTSESDSNGPGLSWRRWEESEVGAAETDVNRSGSGCHAHHPISAETNGAYGRRRSLQPMQCVKAALRRRSPVHRRRHSGVGHPPSTGARARRTRARAAA